jgi:DNA-binding SARP family transcriptional activator
MFWPELDSEHARNALSKSVHYLRQALGGAETIISRSASELAIDRGRLWCDVVAFREASDGDRHEDALQLYRGDLLPAFYIAGSQSQAAALGVILIAVCALSLYVVNRVAGTRVGGLFG